MTKLIDVKSEIGVLKKVLLHRPGAELEQLVPENLDQLLFDDIPYLEAAQREHDQFAGILREQGVEVLYLEDLAAETIAQDISIKEQFIEDFINESGRAAIHYKKELKHLLLSFEDEKEMILKTMKGTSLQEIKEGFSSPLVRSLANEIQFVMDPIPNLYFTRDPFAVIGNGVSMNQMRSIIRNRETIYGRYILERHHNYCGKVPFFYKNSEPFSIEGGDIINLSDTVLAVGISQRTSAEAIDLLARNLFSNEESTINTVLAVDIPNLRAYMHLDTVFTQIDFTTFTIHPGILSSIKTYILRRMGSDGKYCMEQSSDSLANTLSKVLDTGETTLIECGGKDQVASAREQWNDGANTLCISPGVVIVYDRNRVTNKIMEDLGVKVITSPSSELARGRGGPRCMSMPFVRESIK